AQVTEQHGRMATNVAKTLHHQLLAFEIKGMALRPINNAVDHPLPGSFTATERPAHCYWLTGDDTTIGLIAATATGVDIGVHGPCHRLFTRPYVWRGNVGVGPNIISQ